MKVHTYPAGILSLVTLLHSLSFSLLSLPLPVRVVAFVLFGVAWCDVSGWLSLCDVAAVKLSVFKSGSVYHALELNHICLFSCLCFVFFHFFISKISFQNIYVVECVSTSTTNQRRNERETHRKQKQKKNIWKKKKEEKNKIGIDIYISVGRTSSTYI